MTGEKAIPSKVDSTFVDVKYEDIPEERRKQFDAQPQEGAREGHEEIACMLWEDSTRRHREGEVCFAHIHATTAEPIYYGYSCCDICFHYKQCKFFIRIY